MAQVDLYWAEKALSERYVPEDHGWIHTRYRAALVLGGVASALTAGAVLGAIAYRQSTVLPRVALASYEIEALPHRPLPAPLVSARDQVAPAPRPAPVKAVEPPPPSSAPAPAPTALAAPAAVPQPARREEPVEKPRLVDQKQRPTAKPPTPDPAPRQKLAPPAAEPAPAPRVTVPSEHVKAPVPPKPVKAEPHAALQPAPQESARSKPHEPMSAPQPAEQAHSQVGLSKAAGIKPTDIASGEKLGIREIRPDGIVMQNGRRIKNGTPLPNGELLMGTDAEKGMAETDRRVLVLTP